MRWHVALGIGLYAIIGALNLRAQAVPSLPVKPTDTPEILFAAQGPEAEKDDSGKPATSTFEPIAFLVNGEPRDCFPSTPTSQEDEGRNRWTWRLLGAGAGAGGGSNDWRLRAGLPVRCWHGTVL